MDTTTLRTFIALAQIKNFTKTAQQLFVAQSTVTNRIRDLEMELGVPLFIRSHKQVDLTPSGQKFLDYAQRFVSLELAALQDIQSSPTYARKSASARPTPFTNVTSSAASAAPQREEGPVPARHHRPYDGHDAPAPGRDAGRDLFLQRHVPRWLYLPPLPDRLAGPGLPGSQYGICQRYFQGRPAENRLPLLQFRPPGVGLYIQDLFPRHHRFPLEIDNSTKLPQYVADGIGYTFLPKSLIEEDLAEKRLRAIPLLDFEPPKVDSYYITRSPSTIPADLEEELLADCSYGLQGDDHGRHDDDGQEDIK